MRIPALPLESASHLCTSLSSAMTTQGQHTQFHSFTCSFNLQILVRCLSRPATGLGAGTGCPPPPASWSPYSQGTEVRHPWENTYICLSERKLQTPRCKPRCPQRATKFLREVGNTMPKGRCARGKWKNCYPMKCLYLPVLFCSEISEENRLVWQLWGRDP